MTTNDSNLPKMAQIGPKYLHNIPITELKERINSKSAILERIPIKPPPPFES